MAEGVKQTGAQLERTLKAAELGTFRAALRERPSAKERLALRKFSWQKEEEKQNDRSGED